MAQNTSIFTEDDILRINAAQTAFETLLSTHPDALVSFKLAPKGNLQSRFEFSLNSSSTVYSLSVYHTVMRYGIIVGEENGKLESIAFRMISEEDADKLSTEIYDTIMNYSYLKR